MNMFISWCFNMSKRLVVQRSCRRLKRLQLLPACLACGPPACDLRMLHLKGESLKVTGIPISVTTGITWKITGGFVDIFMSYFSSNSWDDVSSVTTLFSFQTYNPIQLTVCYLEPSVQKGRCNGWELCTGIQGLYRQVWLFPRFFANRFWKCKFPYLRDHQNLKPIDVFSL